MPESGDAWRQTCAFFGKIMQECFTVETEIIDAAPIFLALLGRDHKAEVEWNLPARSRTARGHLSLAPEVEIAVFSPDEVPGIAERPRKVA